MAAQFDIIIIGAGPAGLMAARTAGEEGLKVAHQAGIQTTLTTKGILS